MPESQRSGQTDIVVLSDEENVSRVLTLAVENLWEAVNELTRLRCTHKRRYYATIFGSARLKPGTPAYIEVKELARSLSEMGCGIITGGGPGLMQAANEGAALAGGETADASIGIGVELPFEQGANPFVGKAFHHKTFFSRLHHFVIASDAFIVVPGGIGTMLELSMVWQLLQARKLYDTPLVLIGQSWRGLIEWSRRSMIQDGTRLADEKDLQIPLCVDTRQEAVSIISEHFKRWQEEH